MTPNRRSWMGHGFRQAALMLACLGLVLCAGVNAQDTVAKQSGEPVDVAQENTSACGCNSSGCNSCGPCGVGGYGVGGYGTGGYGVGGYGAGGYGTGGYGAGAGVAGGGAGGSGSFDAFGAAGGAGAATPGAGAAPYMIGDLLQANRVISFNYNRVASMGSETVPGFWAVSVDGGAVVNIRNTKVAENNNAIPTDRFAYEYNFFKNGMSCTGTSNDLELAEGYSPWFRYATRKADYDVHVHTFSYEKTFCGGMGSVEIRMPFYQGLSSKLDLVAGSATGVQHYDNHDPWGTGGVGEYNALIVEPTPWNTWGEYAWEIQDVSLIFKFLLYHNPCRERYIAAGLQVTAPTARDVDVAVRDFYGPVELLPGGQPDLDSWLDTYGLRNRRFRIENETWALSPFLAMTSKPTQRTFFNGFLQVDIPLGSNHVRLDQSYWWLPQTLADPDWQLALEEDPEWADYVDPLEGDVADQTLMHVDLAAGYYLYTNPCARVVKAVIPTAEFHLTQTLSDPDRLVLDSGRRLFQISEVDEYLEPYPVVGNPADNNTITDVTVGVHTFLGQASMLSVGGVFPLGQGWDRTFDSEIAVKFNHSF
ncbi:MAG TPA: hypothetical protein VMY37_07220 [Thermoguttaceae bacterium]|nr:hypothetical protein [Thermoguttaceae bacterium]